MHKPKLKLVLRRCACNCGKSWRAYPTSPNKYYSENHNPNKPTPYESRGYKKRVKKERTIPTIDEGPLYNEEE